MTYSYFQIDEVDPGATAILYSAQYELDYLDADEDTQKKMTEEAPSQLEKIITNGYKGLGLEYFFTAGHDEVRVSGNHFRKFCFINFFEFFSF